MGIFVFLGLAAVVIGLVAYYSHDAVVRRELRNAKRFKIGDLPEGELGRIVGEAQALGSTMQAPLSGRQCVLYKVTVEERRGSKHKHWATMITEQQGVPFVIVDDTGRALIDPSSARISLDVDVESQSGTFDDPNEIERAFLARHAEQGEGWVFNKTLRYREAIVFVGERVAVLGAGVREPDPDAPPTAAYRGEQPTRLRFTSSSKHPLVISDGPDTTV